MVSTSKILTVSYGTFSCTLEGFDDSFGTMKAIAEYFRDLASDDRYFGAEPPTPDAEMLARIAEREIARRVEAREQEGQFYLRAAEAEDETETPETEAPETETPETEAPEAGAAAPGAEVEAEVEAPEPAPEAPTQKALAHLTQEATDNAEDHPAAKLTLPEIEGLTRPEEAGAAEEAEEAEEKAASEAQAPAPEPEEAPEIAKAEEQQAEPVDAAVETDSDDSIAARLRRIRSVVARSGDGYGAESYSEDEHAQDFLDRTAAELGATLAEEDAAEGPAADMAADMAKAEAAPADNAYDADFDYDDDDDEDALAGLSARLAAETEAEARAAAETAPETGYDEEDEDESADDTLSQLLADAMPASDGDDAEDDGDTTTGMTPAEAGPETFDDEEPLVLTDAEKVEADTGEDHPLRARVMKMKRSEFEAVIAEGRIEEEFDLLDDGDDEADDTPAEAILSPEDEAELQRELAEVERELAIDAGMIEAEEDAPVETAEADAGPPEDNADDTDGDMAEEMTEETPETGSPRGAARFDEASANDTARLFDTADTHFEAPESSKRRNAIQHLRAAVAATKAERKAGSTLERDSDEGAYRSDLASVVRPRRPAARAAEGGERTRRRPEDSRQAPLKLVAEQRIDTPRQPVRPRRVSTAAMTAEPRPAGTEDSFSAFAERLGAHSLAELLEAAAAYMADIEGRDQFSRPMLMGKLKEIEQDAFSREDGLRSFGQLLREGKLQKVKGGRFTITEHTEFRAKDTRQAG